MNDNPYFWLNIDDYKIAMLNIKNAIQDKDTKNRDFYEDNFSNSLKEVEGYLKKLKDASDKLKDFTFIVDGDELDYFVKYYGLKTLKVYNSDIILTQEDITANEKLEQKIQGVQNLVFLYNDENNLNANKSLIDKYNIKTANIIVYKDDIRYIDILDNNLRSLSSLIPISNPR
jgi:ABC-type Zn uptake system ZnuABC Zn-binding protein ZnuA